MKRKFVIMMISALVSCLILLSSCANPTELIEYANNNPASANHPVKHPTDLKTDIFGYWTDDIQKHALYFGTDGKCRQYELFNNELYEEYWEFNWCFKDDKTVVFTIEVDGEMLSEERNVELKDGNLYVSDYYGSLNYSGSNVPEICFTDTFLNDVPSAFYSHDSFGDNYAINIAWGDLTIYENLPYKEPCQIYYFHMESADATVAYCTLNSGEVLALRMDAEGKVIVTIGEKTYELHKIPYPNLIVSDSSSKSEPEVFTERVTIS